MKRSSRAGAAMRPVLALAAGLLLGAYGAGGRAQAEKGIPPLGNGERLERYIEAYVQFRRTEPEDGMKPAPGHIRQADGLRAWLQKLEAIPRSGLTLDQDVDYRLIRSSILTDIARIERERKREKNAGIGRELYDYYLAETYFMNDDVDSMLKKGERYYAETLKLLEGTAARIDPGRSWQELIRENRRRHPAANDLLPAWEREILRARQHVIDRKLAAIPDDEKVVVLETPAEQRDMSPFGVMDTPQPFADNRTGRLFINPVEAGLAEAVKEKLLSGHDYTFITTIAPHETYPGHHLHALRIQENPRPMRKLYNSTLFTEGWGLYAEELMYETGFFKDAERTRLTQLLSRLWRAARVILDVELQTGRISYEEARRFLEEKILFEPERSAGEVNMYVAAPTYFITYINGYFDIMKLRDEYKRKKGGDFSLLEFHEAVLKTGALPTPLLREILLAAD